MAFCTECGTDIPAGVRFCTECGKQVTTEQPVTAATAAAHDPSAAAVRPTAQAVYTPPAAQSTVVSGAPAPGSRYAVMGTGAYIGAMLLYCIPVVGWIFCIIAAFLSGNQNRRNFARAMLVFLAVGVGLSVALYFAVSSFIRFVVESAQGVISEATGGAVTSFDELGSLFGSVGRLVGLGR